jgi:hypothetical protein
VRPQQQLPRRQAVSSVSNLQLDKAPRLPLVNPQRRRLHGVPQRKRRSSLLPLAPPRRDPLANQQRALQPLEDLVRHPLLHRRLVQPARADSASVERAAQRQQGDLLEPLRPLLELQARRRVPLARPQARLLRLAGFHQAPHRRSDSGPHRSPLAPQRRARRLARRLSPRPPLLLVLQPREGLPLAAQRHRPPRHCLPPPALQRAVALLCSAGLPRNPPQEALDSAALNRRRLSELLRRELRSLAPHPPPQQDPRHRFPLAAPHRRL